MAFQDVEGVERESFLEPDEEQIWDYSILALNDIFEVHVVSRGISSQVPC